MTDYSVNIPKGRVARPGPIEFGVYFALIFLIALPAAAVGWVLTPLFTGRMAVMGPLARARAEARAITPMIFRA